MGERAPPLTLELFPPSPLGRSGGKSSCVVLLQGASRPLVMLYPEHPLGCSLVTLAAQAFSLRRLQSFALRTASQSLSIGCCAPNTLVITGLRPVITVSYCCAVRHLSNVLVLFVSVRSTQTKLSFSCGAKLRNRIYYSAKCFAFCLVTESASHSPFSYTGPQAQYNVT